MEKQVCKACGRELDIALFGKSRWGGGNKRLQRVR